MVLLYGEYRRHLISIGYDKRRKLVIAKVKIMRNKKYSAMCRKLYRVEHKNLRKPEYVIADNHKEVIEVIEKVLLLSDNVEEASIQFIDYVLEK